jgi:hypothetical protein
MIMARRGCIRVNRLVERDDFDLSLDSCIWGNAVWGALVGALRSRVRLTGVLDSLLRFS